MKTPQVLSERFRPYFLNHPPIVRNVYVDEGRMVVSESLISLSEVKSEEIVSMGYTLLGSTVIMKSKDKMGTVATYWYKHGFILCFEIDACVKQPFAFTLHYNQLDADFLRGIMNGTKNVGEIRVSHIVQSTRQAMGLLGIPVDSFARRVMEIEQESSSAFLYPWPVENIDIISFWDRLVWENSPENFRVFDSNDQEIETDQNINPIYYILPKSHPLIKNSRNLETEGTRGIFTKFEAI